MPSASCCYLLPSSPAHLPDPLVEGDRDDDQDPLGEHLVQALHAGQVDAALEDLHDQGAEQRAEHRAAAAEQAGAAGLLAGPEPPTALFSSQNLVTLGAVRALRDRGAQHRTAMVGFDDLLLADLLDPPVTVVAQDVQAIGALAAQILFRRIDGDASPPQTHVIPTRLIPRGSGEIAPP